jgi:hypothetical protein
MGNVTIVNRPGLLNKLKPIIVNKVSIWIAKKIEVHRAKLTLMLSAPIIMAIEKEYEISELALELYEFIESFLV